MCQLRLSLTQRKRLSMSGHVMSVMTDLLTTPPSSGNTDSGANFAYLVNNLFIVGGNISCEDFQQLQRFLGGSGESRASEADYITQLQAKGLVKEKGKIFEEVWAKVYIRRETADNRHVLALSEARVPMKMDHVGVEFNSPPSTITRSLRFCSTRKMVKGDKTKTTLLVALSMILRPKAAIAPKMLTKDTNNIRGSPVESFKVTGCKLKDIKKISKHALRHDLTKLLTIEAGEGENMETFYVHTHLICAHSSFFRAACTDNWREGFENLVRLPTEKPKIVELYLQWLYTFVLPYPKLKPRGVWENLVELYLLGEKVQDQTLKNMIIDIFVTGWKYTSGCRWLSYAHTRLSEDAADNTSLRRLVIDLFVYGDVTSKAFEEEKENFSKEACFEITMAMLKKGESLYRRAPYFADRCTYHVHEAPAVETIEISVRMVDHKSAYRGDGLETRLVCVED
ncbi:MAG: hypothetical protein LQ347_002704 [Umbilicaria vellea]|nr:MAG: hypothetical protein LQ347_002704 [Umbilicaria vellea]